MELCQTVLLTAGGGYQKIKNVDVIFIDSDKVCVHWVISHILLHNG